MPCYDHKVAIQLLPDPLPPLPDFHEPFSLICREGRQILDRSKDMMTVPVDVSGCKRVVVGVQPLEYILRYNRVEKIRITVDVDGRRAVTHYYTVEQIKWCEGELLTDGINLFQNEGIIDVFFESLSQEGKSPPSYRFQLLYNKKPEFNGKTTLCRMSMFRANRNSVAKALWLLENDPYSGRNRQMSKDWLKVDGSESKNGQFDKHKTSQNAFSEIIGRTSGSGSGNFKRKLDIVERRRSDTHDQPVDDKERKMKLIKENHHLEEEIKRLRLIKEQKKLKEELKQLQSEIEDGDWEENNKWHEERQYSGINNKRRDEGSRDVALLMSPPLTINSSIPSMDQSRDRDETDRSSWWNQRTA